MLKETLTLRRGTSADIPFLAKIEYESTLPPTEHCFWDDFLEGTGTDTIKFIEATLETDTSNWGGLEDFSILEEDGKPVAAATSYKPNPENYGPLRYRQIDKLARRLDWSAETTARFLESYTYFWGAERLPICLEPIAPWIIEFVAVVPEARGRGLGKALLGALLEQSRSQHHSLVGITVVNGNDAALRLYQSLGFKPHCIFTARYFFEQFNFEFPGLTKLALRLTE